MTEIETLRAERDMLIDNLIGMCAHRGWQGVPCGQTAHVRAAYCTSCEAAERLKERDALLHKVTALEQQLAEAQATREKAGLLGTATSDGVQRPPSTSSTCEHRNTMIGGIRMPEGYIKPNGPEQCRDCGVILPPRQAVAWFAPMDEAQSGEPARTVLPSKEKESTESTLREREQRD